MTYKEKIIATAYTGIMFVDGSQLGDVYAYEEEKLGHGVLDIMHADKEFCQKVRDAVREDFFKMLKGDYEKMKPLTKEQLYQEAEKEWRLYFDNDKPLPIPMCVFIDGYVTCYAKCLGRHHDELIGMLDEVGNAIQSLHNEAFKDFIVSQIENSESKQIEPNFKVGDEIQDGCNSFIVIGVEHARQRYKTIYKCMAGTDAGISAPHYISFKEQSNFTLVRHAPKFREGQYVKWRGGIFPVNEVNEFEDGYSYVIGTFGVVEECQLFPVTESDIKGLAVK